MKNLQSPKTILATAFLLITCFVGAQVSTVISGFTTHLTKSDLPFSGDRKLYAIGMNDKLTNNYIVVSKNKSGAESDELYIEKFTENATKNFDRSFSYKMTHPINLSLAFVNNRMMYGDIDKDGYAEFLYIVDEYDNGVGSQKQKSIGIVVHNDKAYKLWREKKDAFMENFFTDEFTQLPVVIKEKVLNFWNDLDHTK